MWYYSDVYAESRRLSKLPSRLEYSNGDVYEGQFVRKNPEAFANNTEDNLVRSGAGKMFYANGDLFEVQFLPAVGRQTSC
jgi:hypothetical protein